MCSLGMRAKPSLTSRSTESLLRRRLLSSPIPMGWTTLHFNPRSRSLDPYEGARAPPPARRQTAQALPNLHPRTPRTSRRQEGRLNAAKTRGETRPIEPFVSAYENGSCVGDRLEIPNQSIDGGVDGFIR